MLSSLRPRTKFAGAADTLRGRISAMAFLPYWSNPWIKFPIPAAAVFRSPRRPSSDVSMLAEPDYAVPANRVACRRALLVTRDHLDQCSHSAAGIFASPAGATPGPG